MATLYIDRRGIRLKIEGHALVCYESGERMGTVPLAPLERIFMRGDIELSASVLAHLGERGIGVVILAGLGQKVQLLLPSQHLDANRRLAQYEASLDPARSLSFAMDWMRAKIESNLHYAIEAQQQHPIVRQTIAPIITQLENHLRHLTNHTNIDTLRGLEGASSAAHFRTLIAIAPPDLNFTGRNRRPPRDPLNAVLSLSYTMLHQEAIIACHAVGLDPVIGFYHQLDGGRASLACDIMEPFRTTIDRFAIGLFADKILDPENFTQHTERGCMMDKDNRSHFYHEYQHMIEPLRGQLAHITRELVRALTGCTPNNDFTTPDFLKQPHHHHDEKATPATDEE